MIIKGLNFVCTCYGCPEQYDVFDSSGNQVGYVRLRWGGLTCEYPDCGEELIYEADIGDGWTGSFENEEQRSFHLCAIADEILNRVCTVNTRAENKFCDCLTTDDKYDYWGYWRVCECGFNNVEEAQYCGGCGKKINVVGITKNDIKW
jgi:hypothetical protein